MEKNMGLSAVSAAINNAERLADADVFHYEFGAMTTRCELQFLEVTPAFGMELAHAVEARVAALVKRFNFHAPDSWLNRAINERRVDRVELDQETAAILGCVREHSARTYGAFDISVGTLALRLRRARTPNDVNEARCQLAPYIGLEHWWLEDQTLCFDNRFTRFDLGGVIKEYAVDESAAMVRAAGVTSGLVNYGGDLYAIGCKPNTQRFVAAIVNPLAPETMLFGLDLEDQALTTSAHYARNRVLKSTKGELATQLSHVVGSSAERARWISTTVVSGSALVSGIYSTALLLKDDLSLPAGITAVVVDGQGQLRTMIGEA
jgi:FAD:protein FMN transferase